MAEDKSQRAEDSIVSVMIKQLPQEKNEEMRLCFQDRFMVLKDASRPLEHGEAGHPAEAWCSIAERDPKLQGSCADVSDVEVVCDVYYPSHGKSKRA